MKLIKFNLQRIIKLFRQRKMKSPTIDTPMRIGLTSICLSLSMIISFASSPLKEVVIEGKVINYSDTSAKTITAIECNPWSEISSRHAVKIDSAGNFKTFVNMPYGHNFTIYYDKTFFCQYAEPGDSIYMVIDGNDINSGAKYSGTRAELNNEFGRAYARLFTTFFSEEPPSGQIDKEEYLKVFTNIHSNNLANINKYADSVGMSSEAKNLLAQSALFSLANSALSHDDETPEKVLSFFADSIFGLDEEANLKEMMFPFHLNAYLWRLEEVVKPDSVTQMVEAIISRHPKSLNRDIMLAMYLKDMHEGVSVPELSRDLFHNAGIYELLYGHQNEDEFLPQIKDSQGSIYEWVNGMPTESKYTNLTELLCKEFADKIIYLDLWATWCGPCIAANQSLPEVANFFKDRNIVFVSVALKSDFERWKKHANGRPTNCKDYFIKHDDDAEQIMSSFKLNSGFPAFRIIGKDAKIIDSNPPHPNSATIYDTLTEILSQSQYQ